MRPSSSTRFAHLALLGLALAACSRESATNLYDTFGGMPSAADASAPSKGSATKTTSTSAASTSPSTAEAPLRRLTPTQIGYALFDVLGLSVSTSSLPPLQVDYDGNPNPTAVSGTELRMLLDLARTTAHTANQQGLLATLAPCADATSTADASDEMADSGAWVGASSAEHACLASFVSTVGRRLYGRALSATEIAGLDALFTSARGNTQSVVGADAGPNLGLSYFDAIEVVLQTMIVGSGFLYEREIDAAKSAKVGDVVPLTSPEMARRLAAFLWQSVPDEALLALGEAGQLANAEQVSNEARAMIGSAGALNPKAERAVQAFADQWLALDHVQTATKDTTLYPSFTPALAASMVGETEAFFKEVVFRDDARFETLLTAPWTMMDANVATVYGVTGLDGASFVRVPLPKERAGLITEPAFLAGYSQFAFSSPTIRGHFLRSKLMCDPIDPPPDPKVAANPPTLPPDAGPTDIRDRYALHTNEACSYCHNLMDPLGFAFEAFDTIGAYAPMENGHLANTTGFIVDDRDPDSTPAAVSGATDLAQKLSTSAETQQCFVRQMFRFALVRTEDDTQDATSLQLAQGVFDMKNHNIRELMVAITATDAFRLHRVKAGEPSSAVHPDMPRRNRTVTRRRANVGGAR